MIKCKCGYENPDGALFCAECGTKLEIACPKCGEALPANAKFCFHCGKNLQEGGAQSGEGNNSGNVIAGDVTGSYNTSVTNNTTNNTSNNITNNTTNNTNVYNTYTQAAEPDEFCAVCQKRIPASGKAMFQCKACGKFYCADHMALGQGKCGGCAVLESNAKFDRFKAEIKMKMYDDALSYFKSAMSDPTADPDVFYYAAIAALRGRAASVQQQYVIDSVEKYIKTAITNDPKGIYYYFLAYIKYDFYERRYLRTKPSSKEAFALAIQHGVTRGQIDEMYSLLQVKKPACL